MLAGVRAMLVAAGLGTRLDPLTHELPKPAVPVANHAAAWFGIDHLTRAGYTELVVNTHHLAAELRDALTARAPEGATLSFVHEPRILGTGGGVKRAWRPREGEDFLTWNAKLVFAPDVRAALARHRESGAIATLVLRPMPEHASFAPVLVDGEGRVRAIRGGAPVGSGELSPRMYTGVQVLHPRAHADLPDAGDIIEHAYQRWLQRGDVIASVTDHGPWHDVGVTLGHYLDANLALLRGEVRWPGIEPGPGAVIVAESAHVGAGARLHEVAVGAGARIAAGVRLERSIVWPGAVVSADLTDTIITPRGVVHVRASRQ
jgi:mannose-1-phosphate guanylyltransferase